MSSVAYDARAREAIFPIRVVRGDLYGGLWEVVPSVVHSTLCKIQK